MSPIAFTDCCFLSIPKEGFRLTWEVTQYCPYSCEYCFTWSSPRREKCESDLNLTIKKLQILLNEVQVRDVLITGGEPLSLLSEIKPFLSLLNYKGITFSFSSNLYDEKLFASLCGFKPRTINISIDPPSNLAGPSSFKASYESIERKLDMVEAKELPVKLTSVLTRRNYRGIPLLLDYLSNAISKHQNITKIAINREYPIGHAAGSEPQTKSELGSTFERIKSWASKTLTPITLVNWDIFHSPLQCCPAGKNLISIMPNADVTSCSLLYNLTRSFTMGNLIRDPIGDIIERIIIFEKEIWKYSKLTEQNTLACSACVVQKSCGGGCPATLPIASNHISRRTCELTPRRVRDHERKMLGEFHRDFHIGYSPDPRTFSAPKSQLSKEDEIKIREFVRAKLKPTDLAHTLEHVDCVADLAKYISRKEGASLKITVPAAYFHDIAPREPAMHHMHTFKSAILAKDFLQKRGLFTEEEIIHVQYCIYTSSYGSYLLGYQPLSLEAKVVRDADWLDAIGARGIARVFAFGQAHGAESFGYPEYDPEGFMVTMDMNITGPDKNPIDHFFRKLLKIHALLQTATGKELGEKRHRIMVDFVNEYSEEIELGKNRRRQLQFKLPSSN